MALARSLHGKLIRQITILGARSVVFAVLFAEPSRFGEADDAAFEEALRDVGIVSLPVHNAWR